MAQLHIIIDIDEDPIFFDPHEIAAEIIDAHDEWAMRNDGESMTFVSAK